MIRPDRQVEAAKNGIDIEKRLPAAAAECWLNPRAVLHMTSLSTALSIATPRVPNGPQLVHLQMPPIALHMRSEPPQDLDAYEQLKSRWLDRLVARNFVDISLKQAVTELREIIGGIAKDMEDAPRRARWRRWACSVRLLTDRNSKGEPVLHLRLAFPEA